MPNRPRPRPAPTTFDVFKPGKGKPSPTSRPVIVSDKPPVQDSTLVEQHGAPVPNAHRGAQPILASLSPRRVAPPAHAVHHPYPTPLSAHTDEQAEPVIGDAKKISHGGHIMSRPSGLMASRHATLMHHKVTPAKVRIKPPEPEQKEEPNLAAVPITPIEQPAGLANAKTEGKAELLAAMPVEIRRSVANAEGMTAADWEAPAEVETPVAPVAKKAPAPVTKISINDASEPQTSTQEAPAEEATTPAPELQPATAAAGADAEAAVDEVPMLAIKTKKKSSSDAIVFIIMMVLFLGLGTVVAMLFITGTIAL